MTALCFQQLLACSMLSMHLHFVTQQLVIIIFAKIHWTKRLDAHHCAVVHQLRIQLHDIFSILLLL